MLKEQNHHQNKDCQQQIFHRAEIGSGVASAKGIDTDGNQAQTDGHDHCAGDHRREEAAQRLQKESQDSFKDATDDGSTHNGAVGNHTTAHCCGNRVEHTDETGGGAHYNRNLSANGTDREQLNQGDNAGNQHGVLQKVQLQVGKFAAGNAAGAGDNQQGSQVPDKHGKYMLQAKGNCLFQRHFTVELKSSFGQLVRFLHRKTSLSFFSADKYIILPQRSKLSNMQENVFLSREKRRNNCEFFSNERKNA